MFVPVLVEEVSQSFDAVRILMRWNSMQRNPSYTPPLPLMMIITRTNGGEWVQLLGGGEPGLGVQECKVTSVRSICLLRSCPVRVYFKFGCRSNIPRTR